MKKITQFSFILLFVAVATTTLAFTRDLEPFDEIVLSGNVSALLVAGDAESIEIRNDEDQLDIEVDGNILKVKVKDLIRYNNTPTVEVIITYKALRVLKVRAGANAETDNPITGDKLALRFSSGASGELEIEQNALEVSVFEGADLKLEGKTDWQEVKTYTGGMLSAYQLKANKTLVKANTGGSAKVTAYESIEAKAYTGGSISYKGDPKKVSEKDGLSGTIRSM